MDQATVVVTLLAAPLAAALGPLTLRLLPVISRIGPLIVRFRATPLTPSACYQFATQLHDAVRELGRIVVEWTYNPREPDDRHLMLGHLHFDGDWYRRRDQTPNRSVAPSFGAITLGRHLYQPIHGVERSIFPLELRLGLAAGRATPALAERGAHASTDSTQSTVRADLRRDQGVAWSVATLRTVIAATWEGMAPHFHAAQVTQVLGWMEQANASRRSRKPVRAAGRGGVLVPIRGDDASREAATATLSVYDRPGRRLGTVSLGRMPEPGQGTLAGQLTRLITDILAGWSGPLPRLAYVTDAGPHQAAYYERVLKPMRPPSRPGEPLEGEWVSDDYHASEYIHKLSRALFRDPRRAQAWAWKMCRWLKTKPRAIYRALHSAAAIRSRRSVLGRSKAYREAYGYRRDHIKHLDYVSYRRNHLPIGSGVTEAACKTVFSQRRNHLPIGSGVTEAACKTVFSQRRKRSGMAWSVEGGQRIVDLRVIALSGVWSEVHQSYLQAKRLPEERTQEGSGKRCPRKAA